MKREFEQASDIEDAAEAKRKNWRMSVREQAQLHQTLLRRRAAQRVDNEVPESTLVFIECADELGPLYFSQNSQYTPVTDPS